MIYGYSPADANELRVSEPYGQYFQARGIQPDEENEVHALAYAERVLGMKCGRCHQRTGNNTQGHYWAFCKVTHDTRAHHFCCPGDCELETAAESDVTPETPEASKEQHHAD